MRCGEAPLRRANHKRSQPCGTRSVSVRLRMRDAVHIHRRRHPGVGRREAALGAHRVGGEDVILGVVWPRTRVGRVGRAARAWRTGRRVPAMGDSGDRSSSIFPIWTYFNVHVLV